MDYFNPNYNKTFTWYELDLEDLKETSLEIAVWSHEVISSNQLIGCIRLNLGDGQYQGKPVCWMDAHEKEKDLWWQLFCSGKDVAATLEQHL